MQNFLTQEGMQTPKLINTYQYRQKKGLKLSIFSSPIAKFSTRQIGVQTPARIIYMPTYKFRLKKGLK